MRKEAYGEISEGQSGNPGGRPKVVGQVQELARQHSAEAINTLAAIMKDPKASKPKVTAEPRS
jgi:hypothetical protein